MHWIARLQSENRNQFGFAITYAPHFSGACCAPVIWMLVNSSVLKNSNVLVLSTVCLVLFPRWADCATIQSHSPSSPCMRQSDKHKLCSGLQSTRENCVQVFFSPVWNASCLAWPTCLGCKTNWLSPGLVASCTPVCVERFVYSVCECR